MFDGNQYIIDTNAQIASMKARSRYYRVAGWISAITFAAIFITAYVQAGVITYSYYAGREKALPLWTWLSEHLGPLWNFALWLPFPKTFVFQGTSVSPWFPPLVFYLCLMLCAAGLLHRARKLKAAALEAEKELRLIAPILMSLSAAAAVSQSASVGSVSGTGNTVNATNTVNHTIHDAEKKSLLDKFWIPLAIAAATALIQKLVGGK